MVLLDCFFFLDKAISFRFALLFRSKIQHTATQYLLQLKSFQKFYPAESCTGEEVSMLSCQTQTFDMSALGTGT